MATFSFKKKNVWIASFVMEIYGHFMSVYAPKLHFE